jgi:S-adenosylmethionine synthetase
MFKGGKMNYSLFTSESVCAGHPDKICDQISDAVLDEALRIDSKSRVAVEVLSTANRIIMAGEVTCPRNIDYKKVARKVVNDLGYDKKEYDFDDNAIIETYIHQQSKDISIGADNGGAGDQGLMFGYACNESPQFMPLPIILARELCIGMDKLQNSRLTYLRPDGKSEVTVRYEKGRPKTIEKIVLAKPIPIVKNINEAKNDLYKYLLKPLFKKYNQNKILMEKIIFNGTGKWEIGGPATDTGVTGRKIVVDTYGGMARIGGGCFSGKDPTKVDRSGAYAARYIAKNIVANGLAERCEVQLAYAIGYREPISKSFDTFGTAKKKDKTIADYAWNLLDLSVEGIINGLGLRNAIYRKTASYGHFGYNDYPWEKIV